MCYVREVVPVRHPFQAARRSSTATSRLVSACAAVAVFGCNGTDSAEPDRAEGDKPSLAEAAEAAASPAAVNSASATATSTARPSGSAANAEAAAGSAPTHDALAPIEGKRPVLSNEPGLTRTVPTDRPRVYAKSRNVWIRGTPTYDTQWIGFLWWGDSVPLRSTEPVLGPGCETWYAVEPRGYVCVDGKRATLDASDPLVQGTLAYAHNPDTPNPHLHYGETTGANRYLRLPTEKSQRAREWDFRFRQEWIQKALTTGERAEDLLGVDLTPAKLTSLALPELPSTLQMAHRELIPRSTVAWNAEVLHEGRSFLLTDDLTWVPKDRVKPYAAVDYEGIHLSESIQLPLALFRKRDAVAYRLDESQGFVATEKTYPRLGFAKLTGEKRTMDKVTYHETQSLDWVQEGDAAVPKLREETPWGAPVNGEDTTGKAPKGRGTWVEVSILGGWFVAYEGTKPVFATLMSPGKGGPPHGKIPTLETASTPTGFFKITGKFVTSTMIAPNDLVHSAVPWAQNFSGPYAIHGAYWHNDWGQPKSGGCINLSPKDAKWMFEFSEPAVPDGWHGVRWIPGKEGATSLILTE
jgi:hypothetical protein